MGKPTTSRRIRRGHVAQILDADAAHALAFARTLAGEDEAAAVVTRAYDALWRRGRDLPSPRKRRCFLLRRIADALEADRGPDTVACLRTTCELTASQAGYVLDVPVSAIESVEPSGASAPPSIPSALRRAVLIRSSRLLLPIRSLAIVGGAGGALAVVVLLLLAFGGDRRHGPGPATRPASQPASAPR